jgi:hypothetical protein
MAGTTTRHALNWFPEYAEEPRQTNVGAPPTINVKVTRQWMPKV